MENGNVRSAVIFMIRKMVTLTECSSRHPFNKVLTTGFARFAGRRKICSKSLRGQEALYNIWPSLILFRIISKFFYQAVFFCKFFEMFLASI